MIIWGCGAVLLLAWALTGLIRRYALARSLMDIPNARSSHSIPTPRGGGVAIVASFLLALVVLAGSSLMTPMAATAYLGAGSIVAVLGFADDHGHIAARWRLVGHFVAAGWALYWLRGLAPLDLPWGIFDLGFLGQVLALVYLVWMLNLYNFMDGIDGLAASEAVFVGLSASFIYWWVGATDIAWPPLLMAFAALGFLVWNFPMARIFMGDAGSGFLGIVLALFSIQAAWVSPALLWSWVILLGVFVVDATWTLGRRLLRGEKIYEAHRSHAYQFASRHFGSHARVTLGVAIINLVWLFPISVWVATHQGYGLAGVLVAYLPLCVLAYKFKAGAAE